MRRLIPAVAFLALAVPLARADEKADAAKKLNGSYTVVEVLVDGKPDAEKKNDISAFTIKDGTITAKTKNREEKATFKLDPSKKPAHIDLSPENEKITILGIYETKETDAGLELIIAFSDEGPKGERPKDFKGGKDTFVIKFLRKKDK